MFKSKNRILLSFLAIVIATLACSMPGGAPAATETATPTPTFTATPVPQTETPTPIACKPTVTTSVVANVRSGPGQVYGIIGTIPQGGKANVAGKSTDSEWWYIEFPAGEGGFAWIAGSVTIPDCIPSTLASIVAPPTPIIPTDVPATNTEVAQQEPDPSATPKGIIKIPPVIININSPTPTKIKIIIPKP